MEELHIVSEQQAQQILAGLEKYCGILIPSPYSGLEPISVHIYQKKHQSEPGDCRVLQIRWGMHQIFSFKHFAKFNSEEIVNAIHEILKKNCKKIQEKLFEHCKEILSDFITLILEPELNSRNIILSSYNLKICNTRKNSKNENTGGWPNYCIFISWEDDQEDFLEFVYPVLFNEKTRQFELPVDDIITKLIKYRDSHF